jgi:hypothetical protein
VLTTLLARDIQTQETLQTVKSIHNLLENRDVLIQKLAESMHLGRKTLFKWHEQAGYPLHIRRGRMPNPHSEIIAGQIRGFQATTRLKPGYKRIAESVSNGKPPPYNTVYRLMIPSLHDRNNSKHYIENDKTRNSQISYGT